MASAEGLTNVVAAGRCGVEPHTVAKWRRRFLEQRLDGLVDEPRPAGHGHGRTNPRIPRTTSGPNFRRRTLDILRAQWSL
ncbi:helix-turn-helix domain-containing protein [Pseudarthrobacter siccitolerans]